MNFGVNREWIPYILAGPVIFIYLTLMLNYFLRRGKKNIDYDALAEEESAANSARKKRIDDEYFIVPDLGALPFTGRFAEETAVKKFGALPMVYFGEGKTNNELKLAYGVANLEEIMRMEDNHREFIRSMITWAEALLGAGMNADAEIILNETIRLKSDFKKSRTLLEEIKRKS